VTTTRLHLAVRRFPDYGSVKFCPLVTFHFIHRLTFKLAKINILHSMHNVQFIFHSVHIRPSLTATMFQCFECTWQRNANSDSAQ